MTKLVFLLALLTTQAHAAPWYRFFQDLTLPTQEMIEHDHLPTPLATSTSSIVNLVTVAPSTASTSVTVSSTLDVVRNVTITPAGANTNNVGPGTAVVTGTNIFGKTITENFTIAAAQSTTTTGSKAFKKVTSVNFPQATGSGVILKVGIGNKLGLRRCMDNAGSVIFSTFGGAFETTRGTVAADATHAESNTFIPNGTVNGSNDVDVFYIQNFRCF